MTDVMQPDISVVCDFKNNVNSKGRYMGTPSLTLEILSHSTRSKDMIEKLNTYMLSGVKEYWVVDPRQKKILIYIFKDFTIDEFFTYEKDQVAQSSAFKGLNAEINQVFDE